VHISLYLLIVRDQSPGFDEVGQRAIDVIPTVGLAGPLGVGEPAPQESLGAFIRAHAVADDARTRSDPVAQLARLLGAASKAGLLVRGTCLLTLYRHDGRRCCCQSKDENRCAQHGTPHYLTLDGHWRRIS